MDINIIKLVNKKISIRGIIFIVLLLCCNLSIAMGGGDYLKERRDSGIIGEKKTIAFSEKAQSKKNFHIYRKGESFVTPIVIDDMAYFGINPYFPDRPSQLGYGFMVKCMGWKYRIKTYWEGQDITKERTGFSVNLVSPDKKTLIDIKEIEIPVKSSLNTSLTQEQFNILQTQTYVEDPFVGKERILAAQQAIRWVLTNSSDNYEIIEDSKINFDIEQIGNKEFVRAEVDIFSKEENVIKKSVIWALNVRGFRLKSAEKTRRMETLICHVIADATDYLSAVSKTHMILEAFKFNNNLIYPDLKN